MKCVVSITELCLYLFVSSRSRGNNNGEYWLPVSLGFSVSFYQETQVVIAILNTRMLLYSSIL